MVDKNQINNDLLKTVETFSGTKTEKSGKIYTIKVAGQEECYPSADNFGIELPGFFAGMNAKFGFNSTPHEFSIDVIKNSNISDASLSDLPENNELVDINIGSGFFPVKGRVIHSSYNRSTNGSTISIKVQDRRKDLDNIIVFTDDVGQNSDLSDKGVACVPAYLRSVDNNFVNSDEYNLILTTGATYNQLYETIINCSGWADLGLDPRNVLPSPSILESNLSVHSSGINIFLSNYRWKFNGDTLRNAISAICDDLGFDWYWNLRLNKINLINRSIDFLVSEDNIPYPGDTAPTTSITFGVDDTEAEEFFGLLGAKQEGFIDSDLLSPIDGLETPSGIRFEKAWDKITISFYDGDGVRRSYVPLDKEYALALRDKELWKYFKKRQVDKWGYPTDEGYKAAQHPDFQSRIDDLNIDIGVIDRILRTSEDEVNVPFGSGFIKKPNFDDDDTFITNVFVEKKDLNINLQNLLENKLDSTDYYSTLRKIKSSRDLNQNWIEEWYSKVKNAANTYFGKLYVASGVLNNKNGSFEVIDRAWANIENQLEPGASGFEDGYKIDSKYYPLTPFVDGNYKISAYAVLPEYTVYGPHGKDAPASFSAWNEDENTGFHYVPVKVTQVDNSPKDNRDKDNPFAAFPNGSIVVQFPKLVGESLREDNVLSVNKFIQRFNSSLNATTHDALSLSYTVSPYEYFDASIPVPSQSNRSKKISHVPIKINASGLFEKPDIIYKDSDFLNRYLSAASGIQQESTDRWTGKIAIPVKSNKRYGSGYPDYWVNDISPSGVLKKKFIVNDKFAPWNFFPKSRIETVNYSGPGTSVKYMDIWAKNYVNAKSSRVGKSRNAQITKVGFPTVSFDDYADQNFDPSGLFAPPKHGITDISVQYSINGWTTSYSCKSYFSEFGIDAPLGEKIRGELDKIIHPIEYEFIPIGSSKTKGKSLSDAEEEEKDKEEPLFGGGNQKKKKPPSDVELSSNEVDFGEKDSGQTYTSWKGDADPNRISLTITDGRGFTEVWFYTKNGNAVNNFDAIGLNVVNGGLQPGINLNNTRIGAQPPLILGIVPKQKAVFGPGTTFNVGFTWDAKDKPEEQNTFFYADFYYEDEHGKKTLDVSKEIEVKGKVKPPPPPPPPSGSGGGIPEPPPSSFPSGIIIPCPDGDGFIEIDCDKIIIQQGKVTKEFGLKELCKLTEDVLDSSGNIQLENNWDAGPYSITARELNATNTISLQNAVNDTTFSLSSTDFTIKAGSQDGLGSEIGDGASVNIEAGNGGLSAGNGGDINLSPGTGVSSNGDVKISPGSNLVFGEKTSSYSLLKPSGNIIEARLGDDSVYTIMRAADPVGPNDVVTKSYHDANSGGITKDTIANRPATANDGDLYVATDINGFYIYMV